MKPSEQIMLIGCATVLNTHNSDFRYAVTKKDSAAAMAVIQSMLATLSLAERTLTGEDLG